MMSTFLEVEKQLEALSPRERAELVQRVACQLAETVPGIESTPGGIEQQIRENEEASSGSALRQRELPVPRG